MAANFGEAKQKQTAPNATMRPVGGLPRLTTRSVLLSLWPVRIKESNASSVTRRTERSTARVFSSIVASQNSVLDVISEPGTQNLTVPIAEYATGLVGIHQPQRCLSASAGSLARTWVFACIPPFIPSRETPMRRGGRQLHRRAPEINKHCLAVRCLAGSPE